MKPKNASSTNASSSILKRRNSMVNCNAIVSKNRGNTEYIHRRQNRVHTHLEKTRNTHHRGCTAVTHVPSSSSKQTNVWGRLSSGSATTKSNGRDSWRHKVRFQSTLWYRLAVRVLLMILYDVLREICRKAVFIRNVRIVVVSGAFRVDGFASLPMVSKRFEHKVCSRDKWLVISVDWKRILCVVDGKLRSSSTVLLVLEYREYLVDPAIR